MNSKLRIPLCWKDAALIRLAADCLAVEPSKRPADAEEVARRLAEHADAVGRRARDAELALARAHAQHAAERRARRLKLGLAAAVILGLIAGATGFLLLLEERRTRTADRERLVDESVDGAHQALAAASLTQPPDPEAWADAEASAARAVALAERSDVDAARRDRAAAILAETHALRTKGLRRLAFQERIEEIEHDGLEDDRSSEWLDAAYRDAFRENGLDPAHLDQELLGDEPARASIGLALARWALARRRVIRDPRASDELLNAAMLVDPDADRRELCASFLKNDHESLLRASRSHERLGASPESLLLLSRFLLELNHADEAVAVLRSACARYPGDFQAHHDLAARLSVGERPDYEEITRLISACAAVRPASAHALIDLGRAYHAQEDLPHALDALRRASAIKPARSRGLLMLAVALRDAGEIEASRDAAERAVAAEENAEMLTSIFVHLWNRGATDVAETALRKAIERRPEYARAQLELGRIESARGDYEDAIARLSKAAELAPQSIESRRLLGGAHHRLLHWSAAREAFEAAIKLGDPTPGPALDLGAVLMIEGRTNEAAAVYRRAATRRSTAPADRSTSAADPAEDAERAAALSSPDEALRLAADEERDPVDLARSAQLRGWFRTAAALFVEGAGKNPAVARPLLFQAARAAAAAATGRGSDLNVADVEERTKLRAEALARLRDEAAALRRERDNRFTEGPRVRRALASWKLDGAFPAERRGDFLALTAPERAAWTAFWAEVDALIADTTRLALPDGVALRRTFTAEAIGVTGPLAGLQFAADGRTLYLIGGAGSKTAAIFAVRIERDPATRGISALVEPRAVAAAPHADGGLARSKDGVLYWSTWRKHELGQWSPGREPERFPLAASGAPSGGGGLAFAGEGAAAGALLLSSYADGGFYRVGLSEAVDGVRTPVPGSGKVVARVARGIEGMRFIPSGEEAGSLLVCNWDAGCISLVRVDERTGLPEVDAAGDAEAANFINGVEGASGLDFDPVTGDLLVSSWGSGNGLRLFGGLLR